MLGGVWKRIFDWQYVGRCTPSAVCVRGYLLGVMWERILARQYAWRGYLLGSIWGAEYWIIIITWIGYLLGGMRRDDTCSTVNKTVLAARRYVWKAYSLGDMWQGITWSAVCEVGLLVRPCVR